MTATIRENIAWKIRNFSNWLEEKLLAIADRLSPFPDMYESEVEKDASIEALLQRVHARLDHPCLECKGKGYQIVSSGSDSITCPACKGHGVDITYMAGSKQ